MMANVGGGYEWSLTLHLVVRFIRAHVIIALLAIIAASTASVAPSTILPTIIVTASSLLRPMRGPMRGGGRTTLNPTDELKHALGSFRLIPVFD